MSLSSTHPEPRQSDSDLRSHSFDPMVSTSSPDSFHPVLELCSSSSNLSVSNGLRRRSQTTDTEESVRQDPSLTDAHVSAGSADTRGQEVARNRSETINSIATQTSSGGALNPCQGTVLPRRRGTVQSFETASSGGGRSNGSHRSSFTRAVTSALCAPTTSSPTVAAMTVPSAGSGPRRSLCQSLDGRESIQQETSKVIRGHRPGEEGTVPSASNSAPSSVLGIGRNYRWAWCFACIMCWGLVLALDRLTTYSYQTIAANSFSQHSDLAFISIMRSIIAALAGPPFAVLEVLMGSTVCWTLGLGLYTAGHGITAGSRNVASYTAGISLYEFGTNGLVVLQQTLLSRVTSSRNRALFILLPQATFVIWAFISADVFVALQDRWRLGVGIFCVLGPVTLVPLITLLFLTPSEPAKNGVESRETLAQSSLHSSDDKRSLPSDVRHPEVTASEQANTENSGRKPTASRRKWSASRVLWTVSSLLIKADVLGLILLCTGTVGVLLPVVLAGQDDDTSKWIQPGILTPLLLGALVILPLFVFWEARFAAHPLLPRYLLTSRTFLFGAMAQICLLAGYMSIVTYLPTYLYVVKNSTAREQQNVSSIFSFTYTLAALPVGIIVRYARRFKLVNVFGTAIFTAGLASLISKQPTASPTLFRIIAQLILMGLGGSASMAVIPATVTIDAQRRAAKYKKEAQGVARGNSKPASEAKGTCECACDEGDEVGKAIAALNIFNCFGSAIGSALAGGIWNQLAPKYLTAQLTAINSSAEVASVYAAPLTWISSHAVGGAERQAVVAAYNQVYRVILFAAVGFGIISMLAVLCMPDIELDDRSPLCECGIGEGAKSAATDDDDDGGGDSNGKGDILLGQDFFTRVDGRLGSFWERLRSRVYRQ